MKWNKTEKIEGKYDKFIRSSFKFKGSVLRYFPDFLKLGNLVKYFLQGYTRIKAVETK